MMKKSRPSRLVVETRKMDDWEIRNAADTLLAAGKIENDKALLSLVKKELKSRVKAIEKVTK